MVEDFLLLGQIPGTNIFITFDAWLLFFTSLGIVVLTWLLVRRAAALHPLPMWLRRRLHAKYLDQIAL